MKSENSYDKAFTLSHTLTLYKKKFSNDENLIIYPSAWYEQFFEITLRDKEDYTSNNIDINMDVLLNVMNKHLGSWSLVTDVTGLSNTPLKLQFKFEE